MHYYYNAMAMKGHGQVSVPLVPQCCEGIVIKGPKSTATCI